jgi:hypothetical protein
MRVGVADRFGSRRDRSDATAALATHFHDQSRTARTVVLMTVIHRWIRAVRGKPPL